MVLPVIRSSVMEENRAMDSLLDLLDQQVAARPQAVALALHESSLTYADLDRESTRAAKVLARGGVGPGDLIGLLVERDLETVVWLIGILRLGAAYVPLDPDHPAERTRFVIDDARLVGVVGERSAAARAGIPADRLIDRSAPTQSSLPVLLGPSPSRSTTAYVMYTSGSTGRPKGCVVTHGNILAFIEGARSRFVFRRDDRWALVASHCFDASVWELWGAIAGGATIVVVPLRTLMSPRELVAFLEEEQISVLTQVPAAFRYMVDALVRSDRSLALRHVFLGGERVDLDVVRTFRERLGMGELIVANVYGPTETTVFITTKVLDDEALTSGVRSPIGHPLQHGRTHVLGSDGATVRVGEVGELWLSGSSLAAGYLHRDELTAERFVDLPLGADAQMIRCYRTGDLVRQLTDEGLEYLGRNDDQVKIRGYRIELNEIEVVLRSHPNVLDAAACVVEGASGPLLAACIVCLDPSADYVIRPIRARLKEVLPIHMVPHLFVEVDHLPLTPSRKLDRAEVIRLCSEARSKGSP
jgi:amino acid adenylation domain-containing protein